MNINEMMKDIENRNNIIIGLERELNDKKEIFIKASLEDKIKMNKDMTDIAFEIHDLKRANINLETLIKLKKR